uniref:Tripartite motif-containing protein 35 n=1 Tax=Dicentrarchus labrax TaxID=13489 RepID=A0A8C4NYP2_DICLA
MASRPEENLYCPICLKIFQNPVLLSCSHSFCKACLQTWWTEKTILECPLCKRRSLDKDPPQNLALKNLCEALLLEGTERLSIRSEALCSLHSENLRLFCLDHQQLLCVICLHSETHNTHTIRPIEEAARDCKEGLQEFLQVLREKLEHFKDTKGNLDQTAQDIEVQAQDTKRQIKDVFLTFQKFLKEEEEARIGAVREEKNQKSEMMKTESEALRTEITDLSDTIRVADEVLQAEDISFLQSYKTTAELVQNFQLDVPQQTPEALDVDKHLHNLGKIIHISFQMTPLFILFYLTFRL